METVKEKLERTGKIFIYSEGLKDPKQITRLYFNYRDLWNLSEKEFQKKCKNNFNSRNHLDDPVYKKLIEAEPLIRAYNNWSSEIRAQGIGYIHTQIAKLGQRTMSKDQYEKLFNAIPEQIAREFPYEDMNKLQKFFLPN